MGTRQLDPGGFFGLFILAAARQILPLLTKNFLWAVMPASFAYGFPPVFLQFSTSFPPIFHQFSYNFPPVFFQFSSYFSIYFLWCWYNSIKKEEHLLVWQDFRDIKYSSSRFLIKNYWENNFVATLWNQLRHWIWHQLWLQLQLQLLHQLWLQLQLPHQLPHQLQEQHQWIQNDFHNNIWLNMTALCFHIRLKSFFSSISQTYHLWICFFFIYVVWISIEIGKTNTFFFFAPFWSCFFMDFQNVLLQFSSGFPPGFLQFSSGFLPVFLWEVSLVTNGLLLDENGSFLWLQPQASCFLIIFQSSLASAPLCFSFSVGK